MRNVDREFGVSPSRQAGRNAAARLLQNPTSSTFDLARRFAEDDEEFRQGLYETLFPDPEGS